MQQLINKRKIYFYIFIFLFLSSIFNINFTNTIKNYFLINELEVTGVPKKEKKIILDDLQKFKNKNIFFLKSNIFIKELEKYNFLEKATIKKIFPSKVHISTIKTKFIATTFLNGEKYFVGENGKLSKFDKITVNQKYPMIFGKFKIDEFIYLHQILQKEKFKNFNINTFFYHKNKRWDLLTDDNILIKLPSRKVSTALDYLINIYSSQNLTKGRIFDLRIQNRIIIHD